MSDPKQKLTDAEITDAGLTGWHQLDGALHAQFRTGDFVAGLALVNKIGEAAEASNHHPDLTLTYPEVGVSLSSHDVGGITSRDVALARQISAFAVELGADTATSS